MIVHLTFCHYRIKLHVVLFCCCYRMVQKSLPLPVTSLPRCGTWHQTSSFKLHRFVVIIINDNNNTTMFMVLSPWLRFIARVYPIHAMNAEKRQMATKPHPPLQFIIIQPESWYSLCAKYLLLYVIWYVCFIHTIT